MYFIYKNKIDFPIASFIQNENKNRKLIGSPIILLDDETLHLFRHAIYVYEECIKDFFHYYKFIPEFLNLPTILSIDSFPWIFNYLYQTEFNPISMDVNINYEYMQVTFNLLKGKYVEDNIVYLNTIPDKILRKIDIASLPITTMYEFDITPNKKFKESYLHFTLNYEISIVRVEQLKKFNSFIDKHFLLARALLLDGRKLIC